LFTGRIIVKKTHCYEYLSESKNVNFEKYFQSFDLNILCVQVVPRKDVETN